MEKVMLTFQNIKRQVLEFDNGTDFFALGKCYSKLSCGENNY